MYKAFCRVRSALSLNNSDEYGPGLHHKLAPWFTSLNLHSNESPYPQHCLSLRSSAIYGEIFSSFRLFHILNLNHSAKGSRLEFLWFVISDINSLSLHVASLQYVMLTICSNWQKSNKIATFLFLPFTSFVIKYNYKCSL